jgi:phospholipase/carboxylesterase
MILEYREYGTAHPDSIVILLHGYGSNSDDLITLAPELYNDLPRTKFISVNAPHKFEMDPNSNGRQWFSLLNREEDEMYKNAQIASKAIEKFIYEISDKHKLHNNRVALLGFSQGTMMAMHTAYRMENEIAGVLGYSGLLIKPSSLKNDIISKPKTMLVHGKDDFVVPPECMPIALNALNDAGVKTESKLINNLAHGINKKGIEGGALFLKTLFLI